MTDTVVIIPSRLKARRLPNKPIKLINGKEMILHVYDAAKNSNVGDVLVVTPDKMVEMYSFPRNYMIQEQTEFMRVSNIFILQNQRLL